MRSPCQRNQTCDGRSVSSHLFNLSPATKINLVQRKGGKKPWLYQAWFNLLSGEHHVFYKWKDSAGAGLLLLRHRGSTSNICQEAEINKWFGNFLCFQFVLYLNFPPAGCRSLLGLRVLVKSALFLDATVHGHNLSVRRPLVDIVCMTGAKVGISGVVVNQVRNLYPKTLQIVFVLKNMIMWLYTLICAYILVTISLKVRRRWDNSRIYGYLYIEI